MSSSTNDTDSVSEQDLMELTQLKDATVAALEKLDSEVERHSRASTIDAKNSPTLSDLITQLESQPTIATSQSEQEQIVELCERTSQKIDSICSAGGVSLSQQRNACERLQELYLEYDVLHQKV